MDPKGKIGHRSVRTRFANEESEEPKGAENEKQKKEMEVDEAAPHKASAEIQSPKRKVIRVESQETRGKLWQSARKKQRKWASCQVPLVNHEEPFTGVTIDAVKRPSGTGRQPQWLLKKVVKPAQSICVSSAAMRSWCSRTNSHSKLWQWKEVVERKAHRGRQWKVLGSEQFLGRMVGVLHSEEGRCEKDSSARCSRKTRRKAMSVATGVCLQRGSGTSQKKCGYSLRSPDNAPCLHRNEAWQLGDFYRRTQEGRKAL